MTEIVVDAVVELSSPRDIHEVVETVKANTYKDHDTMYQDLMIIETENGTIAVKSENPTFMVGLMNNLVALKHGLNFGQEEEEE
jgi:hypothetical protein